MSFHLLWFVIGRCLCVGGAPGWGSLPGWTLKERRRHLSGKFAFKWSLIQIVRMPPAAPGRVGAQMFVLGTLQWTCGRLISTRKEIAYDQRMLSLGQNSSENNIESIFELNGKCLEM